MSLIASITAASVRRVRIQTPLYIPYNLLLPRCTCPRIPAFALCPHVHMLTNSPTRPPAFHHDGPFDACAPSRNRHRTKAPMLAWTPSQEMGDQEGILGVPSANDSRLSPLAQATINAMAQSTMGSSPYAAASSTGKKGKRSKDVPKLPPDLDAYFPAGRPTSPKRRETIADAWGKGEPEPFEEFFAGSVGTAVNGAGETGLASAASSIYGGKEGHGNANGKRRERPLRRPTKNLPPPMPIFPPESPTEITTPVDVSPGTATSPGPGGPKRSRSLMHRIKKMREQPNVPVGYEPGPSDEDPSSSSENQHGATRPSHRHQQSLLGKFGNRSPTSPTFPVEEDEKDLPGLPTSPRLHEQDGYFSAPPNSSGLGRKTSIMQRVRGVVGKAR